MASEPAQPVGRLPGPPDVRLNAVFDHYETKALPLMADPSEANSRLRKLRVWFGDRLLAELAQKFLDGWVEARLSGRLGSGRAPAQHGADEGRRLTKDQRRRRKASSKGAGRAPEIRPV